MAEAVLTPRNNDLESGTWTRAAPLTSLRIIRERISEKEKRSGSLPLTMIRRKFVKHYELFFV